MADELKRISAEQIEKTAKNDREKNAYTETAFRGETLVTRRRLPLDAAMLFVNGVAASVFTDEGSYIPEAKDFAIRCAVLELYGNFALPKDVEARYDTVYGDVMTDALEVILDTIDEDQYDELCSAINARIAYRIRTEVQSVERYVSRIVDELKEFERRLQEVFGWMTEKDAAALVERLSQGVDEGKIMDAWIAAGTEDREKNETRRAGDEGNAG